MPNNSFSRAMTLCVVASAAGGAPVAIAQPGAPRAIEEVVVTATRREADLQSLPMSISAVTGERLADKGITDFSDISKVAAGVHLQQVTALTDTSIKVRGVGSSGQGSGVPSVGVLVDGVYQIRPGAAFTEMLDVERVEVLRGPQGTLFGKNTTAGVVRINTNDPRLNEFSGRLQGVLGNLDNRELRGVVNIPLLQDRLALRVTGFTAERDGHTKNVHLDEDTRNIDREGGRARLLWRATDTLQFKFTAETLEQSSRLDWGLVEYGPALTGLGPLPPISLGRMQQQYSFVEDEVDRYVLHADWEVASHTLSLVAASEEISVLQNLDQDESVLLGIPATSGFSRLINTNVTDVTTVEFQVASVWGGPFEYILGAFWQNEELQSDTTLINETRDMVVPRPPSLRDVTSKAIFANGTYNFSDALTFSLGVRYSDDEVDGANSQFAEYPDNAMVSFEEWTYSAKLQYQITPDTMVYIAYDKGFKDGGINRELSGCGRGGRCISPSEATWEPEFSYNHELGIKSEWLDRRLRVNGAIFYQKYEDFQVNTQLPADATVLITNAAKVDSYGIEADFVALLGERMSIDGSVAWIDTTYDEYQNAPCPTPSAPGCIGGAQDLSGKRLDFAHEFTGNIGAEYRAPLAGAGRLEVFSRVDVTYKSAYNAAVNLSRRTEQDGYTLVGLRLGVTSPERWQVTLWGNNITDEEYVIAADDNNYGLRLIQGLTRTYGVTADWYF